MSVHDNSTGRAVAVVTAVIGGIALVGTGAGAAFASVDRISRGDQSSTVAADGVTDLDVNVSAGNVIIRFADVTDAELVVTDAAEGRWQLVRDGSSLELSDRDGWYGWGFGDWSLFGSSFGDERVELVLPERLAGIDADLDLGAGLLEVTGDFGDLDADLAAGRLEVSGSARSVDASISAGRADFVIADASDVSLEVSAGRLEAEFTGTAPSETTLEVSAGALDLTLPDVEYEVSQEVSAGSLDNKLQTRSGARNSVVVSLSAGSAVLRPGD